MADDQGLDRNHEAREDQEPECPASAKPDLRDGIAAGRADQDDARGHPRRGDDRIQIPAAEIGLEDHASVEAGDVGEPVGEGGCFTPRLEGLVDREVDRERPQNGPKERRQREETPARSARGSGESAAPPSWRQRCQL